MKRALLLVFSLFFLSPAIALGDTDHKTFRHFSADLPAGWDGDEQSGFISDDPDEYQLTLGKKDESEDSFVSQISIYLLPNKPGVDTETAARTLAEAQGDTTPPVQRGNFRVFTGEPRTRAMKGMATTMVNASPERLLIIIAQDPLKQGSEEIIASLKGETEEARKMLGR